MPLPSGRMISRVLRIRYCKPVCFVTVFSARLGMCVWNARWRDAEQATIASLFSRDPAALIGNLDKDVLKGSTMD